MLTKNFQKALNQGGLKTVLISFICYALLFVINLIVVGGSIIAMFSGGLDGFSTNLGGGVLLLLLMGLLSAVVGLLICAGQLGCFKDSVEGVAVSFSSFWGNCKGYFLRVLGYGLLCGVVVILIGIILVGIPGGRVGGFWLGLGQLVFGILINAYILPQFYLAVGSYDRKGFVSKNYLPLLIYALIVWILGYIPILGYLCSWLLQLFYPLFIYVLIKEQTSPADNDQMGTPV